MPDANGRIPPVAFRMSEADWERVFGPDEEPELDIEEPEFEITWSPDPSLDGARFEAE